MTTAAVAQLQAEVNRLRHELSTVKAHEQAPGTSDSIYVGQYLVERLVQLGVTVRVPLCAFLPGMLIVIQKMFGVPGDFNLGE